MEVPSAYKNAGIANLVAGIFNIMMGGLLTLSMLMICIGVFWIIPMAVGAWQAYVGYQMMNGTPVSQGKMASIAGIVAGLFNFNMFAIAISVGAMVLVGNDEAVAFLTDNGIE